MEKELVACSTVEADAAESLCGGHRRQTNIRFLIEHFTHFAIANHNRIRAI